MTSGNSNVAQMLRAMRSFLKENDMMAYDLHCDPTASHYLKILLDGVFSPTNFRNEIIWQRAGAKAHAYRRFASSHDVVFFLRER
jgi:site-specific DNA-methyltransferase (adenine-specific)